MVRVVNKLQREAFVLTLKDALHETPTLDGYDAHWRNELELEIEMSKDRSLNDLFDALSEKGIQVASMRTRSNRLEELFMRLVEEKSKTGARA
jgi:ABC-2 type transport system ATP-binding protein